MRSVNSARFDTYTTGEAARILGVSPMTVRAMCERGELPDAKRIGSWWRIPVNSVEAYLPDERAPESRS